MSSGRCEGGGNEIDGQGGGRWRTKRRSGRRRLGCGKWSEHEVERQAREDGVWVEEEGEGRRKNAPPPQFDIRVLSFSKL